MTIFLIAQLYCSDSNYIVISDYCILVLSGDLIYV